MFLINPLMFYLLFNTETLHQRTDYAMKTIFNVTFDVPKGIFRSIVISIIKIKTLIRLFVLKLQTNSRCVTSSVFARSSIAQFVGKPKIWREKLVILHSRMLCSIGYWKMFLNRTRHILDKEYNLKIKQWKYYLWMDGAVGLNKLTKLNWFLDRSLFQILIIYLTTLKTANTEKKKNILVIN